MTVAKADEQVLAQHTVGRNEEFGIRILFVTILTRAIDEPLILK
jgi:hypothetical protein